VLELDPGRDAEARRIVYSSWMNTLARFERRLAGMNARPAVEIADVVVLPPVPDAHNSACCRRTEAVLDLESKCRASR
jgi:hypothetical protein